MDKRLEDARALLEKAGKTIDAAAKKVLCESAIELFEEVAEDSPSEKDLLIIRNSRKAFVRAQIERMGEMSMKNSETTEFFIFNYILRFPNEICEILEENSEQSRTLKWWMAQFAQDIDFSR